ncbi:MAG: nitroreductase family deazaflavin-dependent oxidoreductase [Chloroflexota bacterium]|nr:nitroreductase family deazaflavin-dependent oxidoreductase [Chloroflexota bacterium]
MSSRNDPVIDGFRASGRKQYGPWGPRLLLLTVRGRKSGERRTYPLAFHKDGHRYVVAASKGGAPADPEWYRNLVAHPDVTVEADGEEFRARATPLAKGSERDRLWGQHTAAMPGFRDYETKTTRVIPMVVLERV